MLAATFSACDDDNTDGSSGLKLAIDDDDLTEMTANFTNLQGFRTVPVSTNIRNVNVISSAEWCTAELTDESGTSLRVSVNENTTYFSRVADVVLYAKGVANVVVPVTQSGAEYPYAGNPTVTGTDVVSAKEGETVTILGTYFGIDPRVVKVHFNGVQATVLSVDDEEIRVAMPKITDDTNGMTIDCDVKVAVDGRTAVLATDFAYEKVWHLKTVTGNGTTTFQGGTLAQGQVRGRYLCIDENDNIFVSHRESFTDLHLVKINEAENSVKSLGGPYISNDFVNNTPIVLPDGRILVANDQSNATIGHTYYIFDPENNWEPERVEVTYDVQPGGIWVYKWTYNPDDKCLYGLTSGDIFKVDPETNTGTKFYTGTGKTDSGGSNANIWPYGSEFSADGKTLYVASCNNASIYLGPWKMNMTADDASRAYTRMNINYTAKGAAAPATFNENVADSGFGYCWGVCMGADGKLYMSDVTNHCIRVIDLGTNKVEVFFGSPGNAGNIDGLKDIGRLNGPRGIAWNAKGTALYISDFDGCRIRKIYME